MAVDGVDDFFDDPFFHVKKRYDWALYAEDAVRDVQQVYANIMRDRLLVGNPSVGMTIEEYNDNRLPRCYSAKALLEHFGAWSVVQGWIDPDIHRKVAPRNTTITTPTELADVIEEIAKELNIHWSNVTRNHYEDFRKRHPERGYPFRRRMTEMFGCNNSWTALMSGVRAIMELREHNECERLLGDDTNEKDEQ